MVGWFAFQYFNNSIDTVGDVQFDRELQIPPLAESRVENGVRAFDLTMQHGESDLGRGSMTPTWGINGPHLAPTLRAMRGEQVRIDVTNNLQVASTLHWHGMHLPAEMDGGPHQMVAPGDTWSPDWLIDQPAATLWYHPHLHGESAEHVYRGLAGMFIIDDPEESALALPRNYGVDDIPLIVQDRKFHAGPDYGDRYRHDSARYRRPVPCVHHPECGCCRGGVRGSLGNCSTGRGIRCRPPHPDPAGRRAIGVSGSAGWSQHSPSRSHATRAQPRATPKRSSPDTRTINVCIRIGSANLPATHSTNLSG